MYLYDFTDKLPATVPGVDRKHIIKFNNSWLLTGKAGSIYRYIVAYRALIYKREAGATRFGYANPAPVLTGQPGTPFAESWRAPREFDGVGIAEIQIDLSRIGTTADPLHLVNDQIIVSSNKNEDPRLFETGGKYYLHTHRIFPDETGITPKRNRDIPRKRPFFDFIPGGDDELCVILSELKKEGDDYELGKTCFYAVDPTGYWEKNYGFFTDQGCLNAVYGLGYFSDGFSLLQSSPGLLAKADAYADIPAKLTRPYGDLKDDDPLNSFAKIENYLTSCSKDQKMHAAFSSSGPLLVCGPDRWLGVGHVKVEYDYFEKPASNARGRKLNRFLCNFLRDKAHIAQVSSTKILENPINENEGKVILNDSWMYFSFLYEIEKNGDSYDLCHFSDAFIITDPSDPKMLQFAENLAPTQNGYILSFGENDFRAIMVTITTEEIEQLMIHKPVGFKPQNYNFSIISPSSFGDAHRL